MSNAIESVKKQTYPCKHYIFVNGEQYYRSASEIIQKFNHLTVIYSPIGIYDIDQLISMLVREDFVFYLPEDNSFAATYIEAQIKKSR
ncbi:hypothetical protein [Mannheimia pernigra]|uniref:hypothetical protein n=1 Tax=Mannheimia pernigra TaxID=111844 RepID=UPI001F41D43F|nr:hypothetical protein [Mannheimia pernigra]